MTHPTLTPTQVKAELNRQNQPPDVEDIIPNWESHPDDTHDESSRP